MHRPVRLQSSHPHDGQPPFRTVLGNVRRRMRLKWRGAPLPLDRRGARIAGEWLTRPGRRLVPHPLPRAPEPDRTAVARPLRGSGYAQAEQYVRMNCDRISRRQRRRSFCAAEQIIARIMAHSSSTVVVKPSLTVTPPTPITAESTLMLPADTNPTGPTVTCASPLYSPPRI